MSYLAGVNLTRIDADPMFTLGVIAQDHTGKKYKYIQYESGAGSVAAVAGNVAFYFGTSGASAGDTTKVTSDATDSVGVGAGVLQAAIPDGSYGWVQITGPATLTTALTAGADGNALTAVGAGDGTLDVSALVTDAIVAYAIDASAKIVMCAFPE